MSDTFISKQVRAASTATGLRFAIVVSRFNSFITDRLLAGALDALEAAGARAEDVTVVRVPGSFEIPLAAKKIAEGGLADAVIAIGCVLRGETAHFDYVASEVARGVQLAQLDTGVPVIFCVLTCDTLEQAIDRAGLKSGNKGQEAGQAAVEMANLMRLLGATQPNPTQPSSSALNTTQSAKPARPTGVARRPNRQNKTSRSGKR
jgi:6,7-dimethyl-8-ribityllumazine synthase